MTGHHPPAPGLTWFNGDEVVYTHDWPPNGQITPTGSTPCTYTIEEGATPG